MPWRGWADVGTMAAWTRARDHRHPARRQAAGAARGRDRRRRRRGDRPRPGQGGAGDQGRRRAARPLRAAARTAPRSRSSPTATPRRLELIRHDAAHVMAEAVLELYPGTKVTIGPPIENGFYYDFEFPDGVQGSPRTTCRRSRRRCATHIAADEHFSAATSRSPRRSRSSARQDQDFKVELIEDLVANEGVETVSLYRNGPFEDLCRGPHGPSTGRIKAIKLNSVAGAYWRGDENREMLTRIYGTAFFSKKDLEAHLERIERGESARPPPPRPAARPLHAARGGAGDAVLAAQRDDPAAPDRGPRSASSCASAATRRSPPRRCSTRSSGTAPGTGTTTATTCTSWRTTTAATRCGR